MNTEELIKMDQEIDKEMKSGKYPVVHSDIISKMIDIQLNDKILDENARIFETYCEYLDKLEEIQKLDLKRVLKLFKGADIIDNQKLEKEDSFLISVYMQIQKEHAIDYILKSTNLDTDSLLEAHGMLLDGTSSSKKFDNFHYRMNNRRVVGAWVNGVRHIDYFPIPYDEIDTAMNEFLDYYQENETREEYLFIKPFLIHGMLASLQVFDDGNTRFGRLLQHVNLFHQTNSILNKDFSNPTIYITRMYYQYYQKYRELIKELVTDCNNDVLIEWGIFNLRRLEEQIWNNSSNVEKVLRKKL